jgi:hypothetical protein
MSVPRKLCGSPALAAMVSLLVYISVACAFVSYELPTFHLVLKLDRYTREPTKEQDEEITRLIDEAKGDAPPSESATAVVDELIAKADKKIKQLELHNNEGVKKATAAIYDLLKNSPAEIDLPEDESDAKHRVGAMIAANRSLTLAELIRVLVNELGFKEVKDNKAAKKQAALEANIKCQENAAMVSAFQELSEYYFKEGNRNAGVVHSKVAHALQTLEFPVTEENAMSLGKSSKTKIAGIGEKSAEKILEFVTTGTIEKLEEKRANVG